MGKSRRCLIDNTLLNTLLKTFKFRSQGLIPTLEQINKEANDAKHAMESVASGHASSHSKASSSHQKLSGVVTNLEQPADDLQQTDLRLERGAIQLEAFVGEWIAHRGISRNIVRVQRTDSQQNRLQAQ